MLRSLAVSGFSTVSSDDNGDYVRLTLNIFIKNLKLFIENKELINQIDKKLGY